MGLGPIIWTCLALTVHQTPVQKWYINERVIGLPLSAKDQQRTDIQQFTLLHSADQGKVWEQGPSKRPGDPKPFAFRAPKDGVYWFLVQQVDHKNIVTPRDPNRMKPSMIVIVDTVPPKVKVTAQRLPSGAIRAHWTASDENPDPRSLRLAYHTSAHQDGDWTWLLPASPALEGEKEFDPGQDGKTGEVRVRVQMKDQAENVGEDVFVLQAAAPAAAPNLTSANLGSGKGGAEEPSPFTVIPNTRNDTGPPNQLTSRQSQRPIIEAPPGTMPAQPSSANEAESYRDSMPARGANASPQLNGPSPAPLVGMPIASTSGGQAPPPSQPRIGETPVTPPAAPAGSPPRAPADIPPVKIVKGRQVRIDFTVGKVGPSGLGNADVYVTLDKGATWKKMPGEVSISLPQNAEIHEGKMSGSVGVELPSEGTVYGFIVAARSGGGLAPPPPRPGDPPQALVELDTTPPEGKLRRPQADPNRPNTLLLTWEAKDRNFGERPITLEWADQKDGPWNLIGEASLPNTGQYPWRLPDRLPPRVYLRLTLRDLAGNESRAQTPQPELIDLSVPQTTIIGVAPASR